MFMAQKFGANITVSEGIPLSPLVSPSVENPLTEETEYLFAQLEALNDENYQLRRENTMLRKELFLLRKWKRENEERERVRLTMAGEQASASATNYVFHIDNVEQLNANVKGGAEVNHTKMS